MTPTSSSPSPASTRSSHIAAVLPAGSDNVSVLDQAIRRLLTDGTIEDLTEQWLDPRFSEDPADLPVILTS